MTQHKNKSIDYGIWERSLIKKSHSNLVKFLYEERLVHGRYIGNVWITSDHKEFKYLGVSYKLRPDEKYWVKIRSFLIHGRQAFRDKYNTSP